MPKQLKKIMPWAAIALFLYVVIHNPHGAANTGHHLGSSIAAGAGALAEFVTSLLGGK